MDTRNKVDNVEYEFHHWDKMGSLGITDYFWTIAVGIAAESSSGWLSHNHQALTLTCYTTYVFFTWRL